jgi:hypothetical protein
MEYEELLRVTTAMLKGTEGNYNRMKFGESISVYQDIAKLYAEHMGIPEATGKISYLLQSVALAR